MQHALLENPTHTRMGRPTNLKAWRTFLSNSNRIYVSASDWALPIQHPSPTLHTLWHNGQEQELVKTFDNEFLCYREWDLPKL